MAQHLTMRSGNPVLSEGTFRTERALPGTESMTISGTVNKTALLFVVLFATATFAWNQRPDAGAIVLVGVFGGLVVALVTVFKPNWAPVTAPLYAAFEGLALGGISAVFESRYPGLVSQAVFLTFGVLAALLIAYRSGWIKATENFKLGVVAATGGIFFVYLISFILSFFGMSIPLIHSSGMVGVLFSIFVVIIAALNLVLDFDFIEQGAEQRVPKYMEWYAAFGLMVTLVWLYLEILHLLSKLQERR